MSEGRNAEGQPGYQTLDLVRFECPTYFKINLI